MADSTKVLNKSQSMPVPIAISEAVILPLLITGGGHFKITMTVDKNIMEFEKKGFFGPWRWYRPCYEHFGGCIIDMLIAIFQLMWLTSWIKDRRKSFTPICNAVAKSVINVTCPTFCIYFCRTRMPSSGLFW
jgi:hypothetical protein